MKIPCDKCPGEQSMAMDQNLCLKCIVPNLNDLPAALPSEALAQGASAWIGCFPTAQGKPSNRKGEKKCKSVTFVNIRPQEQIT